MHRGIREAAARLVGRVVCGTGKVSAPCVTRKRVVTCTRETRTAIRANQHLKCTGKCWPTAIVQKSVRARKLPTVRPLFPKFGKPLSADWVINAFNCWNRNSTDAGTRTIKSQTASQRWRPLLKRTTRRSYHSKRNTIFFRISKIGPSPMDSQCAPPPHSLSLRRTHPEYSRQQPRSLCSQVYSPATALKKVWRFKSPIMSSMRRLRRMRIG
jgi:hypothetical protein